MLCRIITLVVGVSPNGKATDSDSVISRFESLYPSFIAGMPGRLYGLSGIFVLCHCMSDTLEDFPDIGTVPFYFFFFPASASGKAQQRKPVLFQNPVFHAVTLQLSWIVFMKGKAVCLHRRHAGFVLPVKYDKVNGRIAADKARFFIWSNPSENSESFTNTKNGLKCPTGLLPAGTFRPLSSMAARYSRQLSLLSG